MTYAQIGYVVPKPKRFENPDDEDDHDHRVQQRFDRSRHRYVRIDQPQDDADHNQHDDYLKQRHDFSPLRQVTQGEALSIKTTCEP